VLNSRLSSRFDRGQRRELSSKVPVHLVEPCARGVRKRLPLTRSRAHRQKGLVGRESDEFSQCRPRLGHLLVSQEEHRIGAQRSCVPSFEVISEAKIVDAPVEEMIEVDEALLDLGWRLL
jgi:hypothetical protein